jgi:two-component system sensor histidine kinase MprB
VSTPSIVERVARAHVFGIALAALSIVAASALALSVVVVWQDDGAAIALGRTLAIELSEPAESDAAREVFIRTELAEQHNFARRIEVWRRGERLGTDGTPNELARFEPNADAACVIASVDGARSRVCVVRAGTGESIVLAAPLAPMIASVVPLVTTVAVVALAVSLLFALLGRRTISESVAPIARFEAEIAALPADTRARTITKRWGAAELDSLAATFDALLRRIDEARARETRFVADAAHELRTPLTRLRTQLELAREEVRDGKPIDPRLDAAVKTAVELGATTEALLAMARDEIGKTEPVELDDVVDAVTARLDEAQRARVRVEPSTHAITDGVAPLLELAAANLIDNALKYTRGAVRVRVGANDRHATISVEDEGDGIADADLARVREPFVRGALAESVRGAGIGLALVDHVARLHEGDLALANTEPRGLCAVLRIRSWHE